jgi:hypothetical protein
VCRCYGASGEGMAPSVLFNSYRWSSPMSQHCHFDASRSLTALEPLPAPHRSVVSMRTATSIDKRLGRSRAGSLSLEGLPVAGFQSS